MLKSDVLNQLKQLKSDIKASRNLAIGIVKGTGQKFGFVTLEETGKDVYLPPDEMQKVLPGDQIEVEIKKDAKNKNMAMVERLIQSDVKVFCGKYVTKGTAHFVEPDLPGMSRWIFVPPPKRKQAKARDYVLCKLSQHPIKSGKAQASVLEVIGDEQSDSIEWKYAFAKHDIQTEWSEQAKAEAQALSEQSIEALKPGRDDLTQIPFVTIDSKATTDMDDALWAETTDSGWTLKVAIADPDALLTEDSAIRNEAIKRGTSVYFPGQQVSMLPSELSSNLCSLVEGQARLAKVVSIEIASDGSIVDSSIIEAVITSHKKLSYSELAAFLENNSKIEGVDEALHDQLKTLNDAAKALGDWRAKNALLHEDRDEFYLELDQSRKIAAIHKKVGSSAHRLVEECMVAANRCAAAFLDSAGIDSIFIAHEGVRSDRLDAVSKLASERLQEEAPALDSLEGFVKHVHQLNHSDENNDLRLLIMRQLEKSHSVSRAQPHFGMGLPRYTTFTSPIRKANDFLIHQQISALLKQKKATPISSKQLTQLESAWQTARSAVYDVEQWLKCQYMQSQKATFDATVLRIFASGFQVRLNENGIEGFVSTKEMEGKYSFHQDVLLLKGKDMSFQLDQQIRVQLKQIDWTRKQMQFQVVSENQTDS